MPTSYRLLTYLGPYWYIQLAGFICSLLYSGSFLVFPWCEKLFIDDVFGSHNPSMLLPAVSLYILAAIVAYVSSIGQMYFYPLASERAKKDMQMDVYKHLRKLTFSFYDTHKTGEIMATFTSDIPTAASGMTALGGDFVFNSVVLLGIFIMIFFIDWKLGLLAIPLLITYSLIPVFLKKPLQKIGEKMQQEKSRLSDHLQESIVGSRKLKALGKEFYDIRKMLETVERLMNINVKQSYVYQIGGISIVIFYLATVLIILAGAPKVFSGAVTFGLLFATSRYFGQLHRPAESLVRNYNQARISIVAAKRIFSFLDSFEEELLENGKVLDSIEGYIEFSNVSFGYNKDSPVLKEINFKAYPGETVAIVGPSGAGKSTLVSLIPRFYTPDSGEINIDGIDIRELNLRCLRTKIGLVFQDIFLFADTVENNIRIGVEDPDRVSFDNIIEAAKAANAHEFIMGLPEQYQTLIGERGIQLSGGQRQRLTIAQSLISNPSILILDEATSSLDTESEKLVQEALNRLRKNRTCFVIAHRLSTILSADKILVLSCGKIVDEGRHEELLTKDGVYSKLFHAQFET